MCPRESEFSVRNLQRTLIPLVFEHFHYGRLAIEDHEVSGPFSDYAELCVKRLQDLGVVSFERIDILTKPVPIDKHSMGAVDMEIEGTGKFRVYGAIDPELNLLPGSKDGSLDRYLSQLCAEGESMIVAIPATPETQEDVEGGVVLYQATHGGVEKLTDGEPQTAEVPFMGDLNIEV